jgi:hypothetical protein
MRKPTLTLALVLAATAGTAGAQSDELTITSSKRIVVYGDEVEITGVLQSRAPNSPVIVAIRRHSEPSFLPVSTTTTDPSGVWAFSFEPTVRSQLQARAGEALSRIVTIRVKPKLTLTPRRGALFTRAVAAGSFRGRYVWFQRRSKQGGWQSIRKVVLDDPPRRFRVKLPKGVSRVRVSLSRRQAAPGYEPAVSRVLVLRRS